MYIWMLLLYLFVSLAWGRKRSLRTYTDTNIPVTLERQGLRKAIAVPLPCKLYVHN